MATIHYGHRHSRDIPQLKVIMYHPLKNIIERIKTDFSLHLCFINMCPEALFTIQMRGVQNALVGEQSS